MSKGGFISHLKWLVLAVFSAFLLSAPAAAQTIVARYNAGGAAVSGTPQWQSVTGAGAVVNTGQVATTGATIDMTHPSIPAGTPMSLFQSELWDTPSAPPMQWSIPVTAGQHEVRLYFAETWSGAFATGARVFGVTIEGQSVLQTYDVFAEVGANKAVMKSFTVTSDSTLNIAFSHVTENPMVKAIEIVALAGQSQQIAATPASAAFGTVTTGGSAQLTVQIKNTGTGNVTLGAGSLSGTNAAEFSAGSLNGTVLTPNQTANLPITFSPATAGSKSASLSLAYGSGKTLVIPLSGTGSTPSGGGDVLFRVKPGSGVTSTTPAWVADSSYVNTGNISSSTATIDLTHPSVPAGTPMAVFQTERWDPAGAPNMTYSFPVGQAGSYQVRLYFAETYWGAMSAGARVMNVAVEGQPVLSNYDVFADVGANKGVVKTFTVNSDATLDVAFTSVKLEPQIRAIEIVKAGGGSGPVLAANPGSLLFGATTVNQTKQLPVTITNTGSAAATISGSSITGANANQFSASVPTSTVQPGASVQATVTFAPTSEGDKAATLFVAYGGQSLSIPLSGTGAASGGGSGPISVAPSTIEWGNTNIGMQVGKTVTVTNTGASTVTIQSAALSGANAGQFSVSGLPSGTTIAAGQSKTATVVFAPTGADGFRTATLTVTTTGGASGTVALSGFAQDMDAKYAVYYVNAGGSLYTGTDPVWSGDTGFNTGNTSATGTTIAKDPSVSAVVPQQVLQTERWDPAAAPELTYTFAVNQPGKYTVRLIFAETYSGAFAVGARVFDVSINGQQVLDNYDIFAKVGANKAVSEQFVVNATNQIQIAFGHVVENPSIVGIQIHKVPEASGPGTLVADQSVVNFGYVGETVPLVLTNSGGTAVTIQSATITNASNPQATFGVTLANQTVAAGQSVTAQVSCNCGPANSGTANLVVTYGNGQTLTVPLKGGGSANVDGQLVIAPNPVDFGSVAVGQTATKQVTVTNTGTFWAKINTGNQTTTGQNAEFSGGLPVDTLIGPGKSVQMTLSAKPTAAGQGSGALTWTYEGQYVMTANLIVTGTTTGGGGTVVHRVKAGSGVTSTSPAWTSDASFVNTGHLQNQATPNMTHPSIPAGTPAAVFNTERWDEAAAPEMAYAFPVTPGSYQVRLYFAENYWGAMSAGSRVFSVAIEGQTVLSNYDIYAEVGANKGVVKSFNVTSDGTLNINFTRNKLDPIVYAIEILGGSGGGTPVGTLNPGSNSLSFGSVATGNSSSKTVTLTNGGNAALQVQNTSITGANANQFADGFTDGSNVTLQPGQSLTLTVTFSPSSSGAKSASLAVAHSGSNSPVSIALSGTGGTSGGGGTSPVSFGKSTLTGTSGLYQPTSLQWGPDGKLYVAEQNGLIRVYTVARNGANKYAVTAQETINLIANIPNHNDNGTAAPDVQGRLLTGITVVGTSSNPIIYAGSSDPRIGAGSSGWDTGLDTNSGVISKLTKSGNSWSKQDLVRGLPRSEENHSVNGLLLNPANNKLYVTYGGNTNNGAPSNNFAMLPEYALGTAILEIDLAAIGNGTHDLPTLNGTGPFGGDDGKNQAKLVANSPVKVFAKGFRNNYDVVLHSNGKLYTVDNGANAGWGGPPINCTNQQSEPGPTTLDSLHWVTEGYYGGHPNPTRGNKSNTWNGKSPVEVAADPRECTFIDRAASGTNVMTVFPQSTNGLMEYKASNFGGQMTGDLLTVGFDNVAYRVKLDSAGTSVAQKTTLFSNVGNTPLDITEGPASTLGGTLWVADYGNSSIVVFEPADFGGGGNACNAGYDGGDADGDGFTNADEMAAGTDPCSAADLPADADGDKVSNKTDPDDDNDGIADTTDVFAIDAQNGKGTTVPVVYTWDNDAPKAGKLLNTGFTGVMTNKTSNYEALFNAAKTTSGGAAGVFTVDEVSAGDAWSWQNNQEYGFQLGVNVSTASSPFAVHTKILAPFAGMTPTGWQSLGIQAGAGDQDNYVKLVLTAGGGSPGVQMAKEEAGNFAEVAKTAESLAGIESIDLWLTVDPATLTIKGEYAIKKGGVTGAKKTAGTTAIPAAWLGNATNGFAAGLMASSSGGPTFPATWDLFEVVPATQSVAAN